MRSQIFLYIAFIAFNDVIGQVIRIECPDTPLQPNLDLEQITGDWHEISRTPNPWENGVCTQITQVAVNNGTALKMRWEEINRSKASFSYKYALSVGRPLLENETASLDVRFTYPDQSYSQPFRIVSTDYNSSMVIYSCYPYFQFRLAGLIYYTENVWILSRKRTLDDQALFRIRELLHGAGVFEQWLEQVDQKDCDNLYNTIDNRFPIEDHGETSQSPAVN